MAAIRKKLVIVGDGACGKTCLLIVFSKDQFPEVYVPTVFENYVADIQIDGKQVCWSASAVYWNLWNYQTFKLISGSLPTLFPLSSTLSTLHPHRYPGRASPLVCIGFGSMMFGEHFCWTSLMNIVYQLVCRSQQGPNWVLITISLASSQGYGRSGGLRSTASTLVPRHRRYFNVF